MAASDLAADDPNGRHGDGELDAVFDAPALWRCEAAARLGIAADDLPGAMSPGPGLPTMLRAAIRSMPIGAGTVVDLGAGTGGVSEWIRRTTGADVVAVEPAPGSRAAAGQLFPELDVVEGDAECSGLPDRFADVVTMWGVVSLLDDLTPVLGETGRLLAPGRHLVIGDLVSASSATWRDHVNVLRSIEALISEVEDGGFDVVDIGCGYVVTDRRWSEQGRTVDAWIETNCVGRDGFDQWYADHQHVATLADRGLAGLVVARRR